MLLVVTRDLGNSNSKHELGRERSSFVYIRGRDLTLWQPWGINMHPEAPMDITEFSLMAIIGLEECVLERKEQKEAKLTLQQ